MITCAQAHGKIGQLLAKSSQPYFQHKLASQIYDMHVASDSHGNAETQAGCEWYGQLWLHVLLQDTVWSSLQLLLPQYLKPGLQIYVQEEQKGPVTFCSPGAVTWPTGSFAVSSDPCSDDGSRTSLLEMPTAGQVVSSSPDLGLLMCSQSS